MMFTYKRRVKFYETDGMRVVHHANYLRYFEESRVEYLRAGGIDLNDLMKDVLLIKTYLRRVDRARLDFEYEVVREKTGEVLTTGKSTNTYTNMNTGRIVRLPAERLGKLVSLSEGDR